MEKTLEKAIRTALQELGVGEASFVVEHPAELSHGDFATNVALVVAKALGQSPQDVAKQVRTRLLGTIPQVADISIAGPGFLNFHLNREFFSTAVTTINNQPTQWGRHDIEKNEVVLFEYTSPNLFKPLHIGNLVGNIVGESISRLFEINGAEVRRCNYPSDIGLTVAKGVWGLKTTGSDPHDINAIGDAYRRGNEAYESGEAKEEIEAINRALYEGDDEVLNSIRSEGLMTSRARLADICETLGTHFDTEIFESEASAPGLKIVRERIGDVFKESEGAVVFEGEKVGLHTRVFINSQGLPTYEAKDVGHHLLKTTAHSDWTRSIIVTGSEQREYFKVLYAALYALYPELKEGQLEHIATGFLTLTTGKMSSRKGNVLTGESLLEEVTTAAYERLTVPEGVSKDQVAKSVAVAAIKYQILKLSVGSNIVFDKEAALSFEGDSGPYLQYTNARINSVLEKAAALGIDDTGAFPPPQPYAIERILYRYEEVTRAALLDRAPHQLVRYLTDLAGAFNAFYAHEKIADQTDVYAPYKVALARAVGQTLQNGLFALGIEAPERM